MLLRRLEGLKDKEMFFFFFFFGERVSEDGRDLENMTSNKIQQLATDEQVHEDISPTK